MIVALLLTAVLIASGGAFKGLLIPAIILILLLAWLISAVVAITFAEGGFRARGTNAEWVIAFFGSPILALLMSTGEKATDQDAIDLNDHERLSKL